MHLIFFYRLFLPMDGKGTVLCVCGILVQKTRFLLTSGLSLKCMGSRTKCMWVTSLPQKLSYTEEYFCPKFLSSHFHLLTSQLIHKNLQYFPNALKPQTQQDNLYFVISSVIYCNCDFTIEEMFSLIYSRKRNTFYLPLL